MKLVAFLSLFFAVTSTYGFEDGSVETLIEGYGYPVETHTITTVDGYILKMHRIPKGINGKSNGKVAFLMHGILSSSADWVIVGPNKALAFLLAEAGYDVWLGNARGNTNCRAHEWLDPDKDAEKFWDFSWHEVGTIDLPAMLDYVTNYTGVESVYYAGHSQGTTSFYVMASSKPEYNDKIKVQVSLAPIAYMNHMTSPLIHIIAFWEGIIKDLMDFIGWYEFAPSDSFMHTILGQGMCKNALTSILCKNSLFAICGFSPSEMNTTLLPLLMQYTPAGSSTKQFMHYGQEINSGHFRQYDYGLIKNMEKYGSMGPPNYDLKKITAPVYLVWSKNDWLSAERDVENLCEGMTNGCMGMILVTDYSFNHLDYTYGIDAPKVVYPKVISIFAKH